MVPTVNEDSAAPRADLKVSDALAEVDRLRTALKKIARYTDHNANFEYISVALQAIAREALARGHGQSNETEAERLREYHGLSSLHLFVDDGSPAWRVFGNRRDPQGVQASVEEGRGETISGALRSLNERLIAGVFNRAPWNEIGHEAVNASEEKP